MSMGLGIWSMHFIGMLAFELPMTTSYSLPVTCASLVVAILVAAALGQAVSRSDLRDHNAAGDWAPAP